MSIEGAVRDEVARELHRIMNVSKIRRADHRRASERRRAQTQRRLSDYRPAIVNTLSQSPAG